MNDRGRAPRIRGPGPSPARRDRASPVGPPARAPTHRLGLCRSHGRVSWVAMRTTTLTPLDLRRRLGEILDAASTGERFVIERGHRPLAMLVSVEDGRRLDEDAAERTRRALAALDRMAERARSRPDPWRPGGLTAVESIPLDPSRG